VRDSNRIYIEAKQVRLLDQDRKLIGIYRPVEAKEIANERDQDLIPLNTNCDPAVFMLGDMGKYQYEKNKAQKAQQKQNRANAKASEEKELRLPADTTKSSEGDRMRLYEKGDEFLTEGHPVQFVVKFRGRMMQHAPDVMERIREELTQFVPNGIQERSAQAGNQFRIRMTPAKAQKKAQ
jgi:translation initiation factor IF-3